MRLPVLALLAALPAGTALAETGRWSLATDSAGCTVSFTSEDVDDGIFFVDRGDADCGAELNRITGYALNEEGAVIVLFSTLEGVEQIGQLHRQEDGDFSGQLRGGVAVRLSHAGGPRAITDPDAVAATADGADDDEALADAPLAAAPATGPCLTYAGGTDCAAPADLGPPDSGEILVLTRLNLRDQGTTQGSTVIGRVEAGACLPVTFCAEDEQGRLWCGVQAPAGPGHVLKQDAETVYARNSCR